QINRIIAWSLFCFVVKIAVAAGELFIQKHQAAGTFIDQPLVVSLILIRSAVAAFIKGPKEVCSHCQLLISLLNRLRPALFLIFKRRDNSKFKAVLFPQLKCRLPGPKLNTHFARNEYPFKT